MFSVIVDLAKYLNFLLHTRHLSLKTWRIIKDLCSVSNTTNQLTSLKDLVVTEE